MAEIREYGRTELALLYIPHVTPQAAWRRLRSWIERWPTLLQQLQKAGYHCDQRTFTPQQVRLIFDHIGEP